MNSKASSEKIKKEKEDKQTNINTNKKKNQLKSSVDCCRRVINLICLEQQLWSDMEYLTKYDHYNI